MKGPSELGEIAKIPEPPYGLPKSIIQYKCTHKSASIFFPYKVYKCIPASAYETICAVKCKDGTWFLEARMVDILLESLEVNIKLRVLQQFTQAIGLI